MQLTASQERLLTDLPAWWKNKQQVAILEAPAGFGKAQPLYSKVLTDKGWSTMADINKGDTVVSEEGTFVKVLEVFPQENLHIYELTFSDGSKVQCCEDHLWEIQTTDMRKRGTFKVMSLKDMLPKIQRTKTIKDSYTYSVRLPKPIAFPEIQLIDMYDLGYVIGNGHSSKYQLVVTLGIEDYTEILSYFNPDNLISHKEKDSSVALISLNVEFKKIYNSLGLQHKLAREKHIPPECFLGSITQRKELLAGLLDSDGTCSKNKAKFDTTSLQLAKDVQQLVRSLGGIASLGKAREGEFFVLFRTPFNPFKLQRKAKNYTVRSLDVIGNKRITSAEYVGTMEGKCILVDSKTHLYITDDYTVTHNTFMVKKFLDLMGRRIKPLILAETNEAVNVLRQGLGSKYVTKTVCSAFNLSIGHIDGVKQLVQYNEPDFKDTNLLIVDECSMLGKERLIMILRTAASLGIKVLLIGHSSQLPPVEARNDEHGCLSPAFDHSFYETYAIEVPQKFYLYEPVRNTTEIFAFCTEVESLLRKRGVIPYKFVVGHSFLSSYLSEQKGISSFLEGKTVALAYSNKRVAEINKIVREGLFGSLANEEHFLINDRIIFRQPTFCFWTKLKDTLRSVEELLKVKKTVFTTNTKAVITAITFKTVLGIDCWELKVESNHYEEGKQVGYCYYPLNREDVVTYFQKLHNFAVWEKNPLLSQKKYDIAHAVGSIFGVDARDEKHDLRHSYAITCDCSQGATIDNVIVDEEDIDRCVRNRVLMLKVKYTAFSRARVNLWRMQ